MSPVHHFWPKSSCKAQWRGGRGGEKEEKADRRTDWKTTSGNRQAVVRQVPEGDGEQRKMEETGSEIIFGAPTTLAVKELMMMMMWQGDLCSPYLYLIWAEVLSSMIHNNQNIKGLLNEKTILLSQIVDDTTFFFFFFFFLLFFFFDGSEESFMQAICTLQTFAKISGLKMNLDQTQVVWIGSKTKSHSLDTFLREMNICWDPGISCAWG